MIKGIFEALSGNLIILWVMFFLCPVYLLLGNLIANLYKSSWIFATNKQSIIYQTVGDISWLFPFANNKQEIRLTDVILISVLCAILSLTIVAAQIWNNMQEKAQKRLESEIKEEMKKKQK